VYLHRVGRDDRPAELPRNCEPSSPGEGPAGNRLLYLLPRSVRARLESYLEPVYLGRKDVLFRSHEPLTTVYFPGTAVVSLISTLESGESLEVGIVGRDGFAPTALVPGVTTMPCDAVVQVPGLACSISAEILRHEMMANDVLSSTLGRFGHLSLARSMQMSVCNVFHSVEQRCIRRLLMIGDLIDTNDIPLTHDLMATMLGVHRPTVTLVLRSLHGAGLVNETRGRISIRDRGRLERACCECYRAMRDEQRRLLGY